MVNAQARANSKHSQSYTHQPPIRDTWQLQTSGLRCVQRDPRIPNRATSTDMTHEIWQPSVNRQDPQHMAAADIRHEMRLVLHMHPKPSHLNWHDPWNLTAGCTGQKMSTVQNIQKMALSTSHEGNSLCLYHPSALQKSDSHSHAQTHSYTCIWIGALCIFEFCFLSYSHTHTQTCIWIPSFKKVLLVKTRKKGKCLSFIR